MPPWWVYQKTGSGATSVWPFYVVLIVWVLCQTGQSHFTATPALNLTLSGQHRTARCWSLRSPFSGVPTTGALGFLCPNMGLRLSNPGCGVTHIAFTEMM